MWVRTVDPRDQLIEISLEAFRVYFVDGLLVEEFELRDCDLREALDWVEDNAKGRGFRFFGVGLGSPKTLVNLVQSDGHDG